MRPPLLKDFTNLYFHNSIQLFLCKKNICFFYLFYPGQYKFLKIEGYGLLECRRDILCLQMLC
jgi:hypothetical protein